MTDTRHLYRKTRDTMVIRNHPSVPWLLIFNFPFSWERVDRFKHYPGVVNGKHLLGDKRLWVAPRCALNWITKVGETEFKLDVRDESTEIEYKQYPIESELYKTHYPWVIEAAERFVHYNRGFIAFDMGLAKSAAAIVAARTRLRGQEFGRVIVVCLRAVVPSWKNEFQLWWGDKPPGIQVVIYTYGTLYKIANTAIADTIIVDESHIVKKTKIRAHKSVAMLRRRNQNALILNLTGTPVANRPEDLRGQLEILEPDSTGFHKQFCDRYCSTKVNTWRPQGYDWVGLNTKYVNELQERMAPFFYRVTDSDPRVKAILPELRTRITRKPVDKAAFKKLAKELRALADPQHGPKQHKEKYRQYLSTSAPLKIKEAKRMILDAFEQDFDKVLVFCVRRATAHAINTWTVKGDLALPKDIVATTITGEIGNPEKREELIENTSAAKRSLVVATIGSCGTGVNVLKQYAYTLFAELDYYPMNNQQAAKRSHRIGSTRATTIDFLVLDGLIEEKIAENVLEKMRDADILVGQGSAASAMMEALDSDENDWRDNMVAAAAESFLLLEDEL